MFLSQHEKCFCFHSKTLSSRIRVPLKTGQKIPSYFELFSVNHRAEGERADLILDNLDSCLKSRQTQKAAMVIAK